VNRSGHPSNPTTTVSPFRLLLEINALSLGRKVLALRQKSRLWVGVIGVFLVGYAVMAYALFHQGLQFLSRFPGLGGLLVERLIFLLFACLFQLLSEPGVGVPPAPTHPTGGHLPMEVYRIGLAGLLGLSVLDRTAAPGLRACIAG
jgi:hypothetical protein